MRQRRRLRRTGQAGRLETQAAHARAGQSGAWHGAASAQAYPGGRDRQAVWARAAHHRRSDPAHEGCVSQIVVRRQKPRRRRASDVARHSLARLGDVPHRFADRRGRGVHGERRRTADIGRRLGRGRVAVPREFLRHDHERLLPGSRLPLACQDLGLARLAATGAARRAAVAVVHEPGSQGDALRGTDRVGQLHAVHRRGGARRGRKRSAPHYQSRESARH